MHVPRWLYDLSPRWLRRALYMIAPITEAEAAYTRYMLHVIGADKPQAGTAPDDYYVVDEADAD